MADKIPDAFKEVLNKDVDSRTLATLMKDGSPQVTPVWYDFDGLISASIQPRAG